jgi:3-phosphoshikimate 1-carboxyvinyltransferase
MSGAIILSAPQFIDNVQPVLPSSKSISNRLLILNALSDHPAEIHDLSEADDTRILNKLLNENSFEENCGDGGTTLRFLLALRAAQDHRSLLCGSGSLSARPLIPLLDALQQLGAEFEFADHDNSLPLRIKKGIRSGSSVTIRSDVSSQFISALMMIAPVLSGGLTIHLKGETVSGGYIQTTRQLMEMFGVEVQMNPDRIIIAQQDYRPMDMTVGADWSAAGYWFAIAACLPGSVIRLRNLQTDGLQPDERLYSWMKVFGVHSEILNDGILLQSESVSPDRPLQFDFTDCPDLAQTFAVTAAVTGISLRLTGLSTLPLKETDRIHALKNELIKTGIEFYSGKGFIEISGKADRQLISGSVFNTWNDHRMAMSLSLLACTGANVRLDNPEVVNKSYPGYFEELKKAGFIIQNA